jgi:hypothetical protein
MKYSSGPPSHERMTRSIELYGRKVVPRAREMMSEEGSNRAAALHGSSSA